MCKWSIFGYFHSNNEYHDWNYLYHFKCLFREQKCRFNFAETWILDGKIFCSNQVRIGKILPVPILAIVIIYIFKKIQKRFSEFKNQLPNPIPKTPFLNTLDFNPEIITTTIFLCFVLVICGALFLFHQFGLINENIIYSFMPVLFIDVILPIYMYLKNRNLRRFVFEEVYPIF